MVKVVVTSNISWDTYPFRSSSHNHVYTFQVWVKTSKETVWLQSLFHVCPWTLECCPVCTLRKCDSSTAFLNAWKLACFQLSIKYTVTDYHILFCFLACFLCCFFPSIFSLLQSNFDVILYVLHLTLGPVVCSLKTSFCHMRKND